MAPPRVYRFRAGLCRCALALSPKTIIRAGARQVSAVEAVVDAAPGLREGSCISLTLELFGGPRIPLLARVTKAGSDQTVLTWLHNVREEARSLETTLAELAARSGSAALPALKRTLKLREDVGAVIRKKAITVSSTDLAARHEKLQVLDVGIIKALIQEAVDEAAENLGQTLLEEERKRLLDEAEETFKDRLASFQAVKAGLEAQAKRLQSELATAQALLEEERRRIMEADRFTVSDAGMLELERRLARMLDRGMQAGGVSGQLEADMRAVVARLLDDEREKISARAQEAQSDRIKLLERKIGRLAHSLEATERERDAARQRAQALETSGGYPLHNALAPGLDESDPQKEKKLLLLKQILEENKTMRAQLRSLGALPRRRRPQSAGEKAESSTAPEGVVKRMAAANVEPAPQESVVEVVEEPAS